MADLRIQGIDIEYTAGADLTQYRAVTILNNSVVHANYLSSVHYGNVVGVLVKPALSGQPAQIRTMGPLYNPNWVWAATLPVFFNEFGELTQTPLLYPSLSFWQPIGQAMSAQEILIQQTFPVEKL